MFNVPTARLAGAMLALALAVSQPAACGAEPLPDIPAPEPVPTVSFTIRASRSLEKITKFFTFTITTFEASGEPGLIRNPETGEEQLSPYTSGETTPVRIEVELFPGIVGASIYVRTNLRKGETLSCQAQRNGLPVRDALASSAVTQKIVSGPVSVSCAYVGG